MKVPAELKYTKDHEWVRIEGSSAIMGITEFAQSELGEIVFCELPAIGKNVKQGETVCVLESTKAASDVYAPISGSVSEVNTSLSDDPTKINSASYKEGWLVKLSGVNASELSGLMDAAAYEKHIGK